MNVIKNNENETKLKGIYKWVNPNNKVYIGQSIDILKRKKIHEGLYEDKNISKLKRSFKKYGVENHKFEIIEECLIGDLDKREIYWKHYYINLIGWKNVLFCKLHDNGGGPLSKEIKEKISRGKINHKCYKDPKRGKKISDKLKGRKITWEKGGLKNKGKSKPKGFGEKVSKRKSIPILQFDKQGNFIKEWKSLTEAANYYKIHPNNIGGALQNKAKTSHGYIWKYKNKIYE